MAVADDMAGALGGCVCERDGVGVAWFFGGVKWMD